MKIIFCLSNLFVPATLTIVKNSRKSKIMIYTDQVGMYKFFNSLNIDNVTVFLRKPIKIEKKIHSVYKFYLAKKNLLRDLQQFNFKEVIFFHNTFGDIENWLIKKLSVTANVVQIPIFNELPFEKRYSLISLKGCLLSWLKNGVRVLPLYTGSHYIYKMANSFYKGIDAKKEEILIDNNFIKDIIDKNFNISNKKIVLLTGTVVELNQVKEEEYVNKINKLISYIGIDKIVTKPHPRFPNRFGVEKNIDELPSFIPANVLFSKFKIFIGYTSCVLAEAANEGLIAISLLDYLEPVSDEKRDMYKEYLLRNLKDKNKNIYFPDSEVEIKNILNDVAFC